MAKQTQLTAEDRKAQMREELISELQVVDQQLRDLDQTLEPEKTQKDKADAARKSADEAYTKAAQKVNECAKVQNEANTALEKKQQMVTEAKASIVRRQQFLNGELAKVLGVSSPYTGRRYNRDGFADRVGEYDVNHTHVGPGYYGGNY